jgi:hypothetical protein
MNTITIRAKVHENVTTEGIGFPDMVVLTGAQFFSRNAAQELAQEAVDASYGSYESGFLAVINMDRWNEYRDAGTDNGFTVPVVAV